MTSPMMPEDFENGIAEMIEKGDGYPPLRDLQKRQPTEIRLKSGGEDDEVALAMKFSYSAIINQYSKITQKFYGYVRDGNLAGPLEQSSVRGAHSLNDLIFDAPCVNRDGRFEEEEARIKDLLPLIKGSSSAIVDIDDEDGENAPALDIDDLLDRWSDADAFMLHARIYEERHGIDAAEHLYAEYDEKAKEKDEVLQEASKLSPAEHTVFDCRVRQYEILRERSFDLAMGYPTHDFTDVKREIAEGNNIHDFVHRMAWPFRQAYHLVTGSMMDGVAYREMMMAMTAQQLPSKMPPWAMSPGFWPGGMMPNGHMGEEGEDEDGQQDTRPALFKLFGRKGQDPNENHIKRNGRGSRR